MRQQALTPFCSSFHLMTLLKVLVSNFAVAFVKMVQSNEFNVKARFMVEDLSANLYNGCSIMSVSRA